MAPSPKAPAKATDPEAAPIPFEVALERLEDVVESLETGDLALEVALERFEEGVHLVSGCSEQLEAAERRVESLVQAGGGLVAQPFELGEDSGEDSEEEAG
ncbi:MAG: exodeoxyribonuclease VII small subunit [Myxococcota bacterium]|nr:exodeoxyribonuclease VII small subunit [Myxococcota bacterium]